MLKKKQTVFLSTSPCIPFTSYIRHSFSPLPHSPSFQELNIIHFLLFFSFHFYRRDTSSSYKDHLMTPSFFKKQNTSVLHKIIRITLLFLY